MKMPKKTIQKWIDALRSGKYEQTAGFLQHGNSYCCLGVACKLFVPEHQVRNNGELRGNLPLAKYGAPNWLVYINDDFGIRTGNRLSFLNDGMGLTFDEIADLLQAVYIEEVL